ncbi:hypothetical protein CHS0354_010603 [Potamilus streckersoni]|uniref:Uncharacterized protein n=1 Tax=Potamilus streckersoni TaxID=2493646 RepID=A0AAE0VUK6_9BIVA|nr:hypothetical protein CHS0354_010603 [Potamilus streckersoni]
MRAYIQGQKKRTHIQSQKRAYIQGQITKTYSGSDDEDMYSRSDDEDMYSRSDDEDMYSRSDDEDMYSRSDSIKDVYWALNQTRNTTFVSKGSSMGTYIQFKKIISSHFKI